MTSAVKTMDNNNLISKTFKLALPAITDMFIQMLFGFADMAMVGTLGAASIAAVGLSDMPMMTATSLFAAVSIGATSLVSRAIGAKNKNEAESVAKQSLIIGFFMSIIFLFLGLLLARPIVVAMGAEPDVIPLSTGYFKIATLGLPFVITSLILTGVLRGSGDTKTPMLINSISIIMNVALNFLFIFPTRDISFLNLTFTMPGLGFGVFGAAMGTTISRSFAGLLMFFLLIKNKLLVSIDLKTGFKPDFIVIKRILNIGVPAAIEQFLMRFGQLIFGRIVASLGTVMYASHRITLTAESMSFYVGFGFALAATTLVGQYLGAKKPDLAEKSGFIAVGMGVLFMTTVGIFFFLVPDLFLKLFTRDENILVNARVCLRIVAISQPFLACVMGFAGALRGAGDTKTVLFITLIGVWGVRITLAYLLAITLNFGLIGAWIGMTIDLILRGTLLFTMFKRGKWKNIDV